LIDSYKGKGQIEGKGKREKGKGVEAFLTLFEKQTAIVLFCVDNPLVNRNSIATK
jgi:hypothetical protein